MNTSDLDDLLALAALGELDDHDEARLRELAAADASIDREVDGLLEVAARVQASKPVEPPASLRDAVLAAVAATAQFDDPSRDPRPPSHIGPGDRSTMTSRERMPWKASRWMFAVAAALVVVVGAALVVQFSEGPGSDPIEEVLAAPDAAEYEFGFTSDVGATLRLVYSADVGASVLAGDSVEMLSSEFAYQLWQLGEGAPIPVGLFRPDVDGAVAARFDELDPTTAPIAVTVEPDGGSPAPTTPILAST